METANAFKKILAFRITKYCRCLQNIKNVSTSVQEKATKQKAKEKNEKKMEKRSYATCQ